MTGYPSDRLHEEVAYVAHHLHWSYRDVMGMEHTERLRWVHEAAQLQQQGPVLGDPGGDGGGEHGDW
jgi:hypothetical protein